MLHRIHKCANTLYDYAIINLILMLIQYVNSKKIGEAFTSTYGGIGPSSYENRIYRGGLLRTTVLEELSSIIYTQITLEGTETQYPHKKKKKKTCPLSTEKIRRNPGNRKANTLNWKHQ